MPYVVYLCRYNTDYTATKLESERESPTCVVYNIKWEKESKKFEAWKIHKNVLAVTVMNAKHKDALETIYTYLYIQLYEQYYRMFVYKLTNETKKKGFRTKSNSI